MLAVTGVLYSFFISLTLTYGEIILIQGHYTPLLLRIFVHSLKKIRVSFIKFMSMYIAIASLIELKLYAAHSKIKE